MMRFWVITMPILYNSDYYRSVLYMGAILAVIAVVLNAWLIPKFGLDGAAIASFFCVWFL